MRRYIPEIRKIYRVGANIFLNFAAPPLLERVRPDNGHLNLAANIHSSLELEKLFKHIVANGGVSSLSLRDNALDSKDAKIIAHYLGNTGIRSLNLAFNNIDDEGVQALAGNLSNLTTLDLTDNKIGLSGARALLKSLCNNRSLQNVSLGDNDLFGENANLFSQDLLELLRSNRDLRRLNFEPMTTVPSKQDQEKIRDAARDNPRLEEILCKKQVGYPGNDESWKSAAMKRSSDYAPEVSINGSNAGLSAADVVNDYSVILLARMIRKIVADRSEITLDHNMIKSLEKASKERAEEILLRDLTKKEIQNFSAIWHGGFRQTRSQKLRDYGNESWEYLTKEKETKVPIEIAGEAGWRLVNLENAQELKEEGAALQHCVGGYGGLCISGESHILSLRKEGRPFATLELGMANSKVHIKQYHGARNSAPDESQQKVAQWFIDGVNNKTIPRLSTNGSRCSAGLVTRIGFDPFDDAKFREVISEFKNKILPSGKLKIPTLTRNFNEVFLGDIRLDDGIFGYQKGLALRSLRAEERTREEQIEEKFVGVAQTALNRIFGQNEKGAPIAKSSLIEGELFIFTDEKTAERLKSSLLKGQVEERDDGIKITGKLEEIRKVLADAGKQEKKARKTKDDSDLPSTTVRNPTLRSRDTGDLQRS